MKQRFEDWDDESLVIDGQSVEGEISTSPAHQDTDLVRAFVEQSAENTRLLAEVVKAIATASARGDNVHINIPAELKIPAPQVHVNVPQQKAADIHVHVPDQTPPDVVLQADMSQMRPPIVRVAAPSITVAAPSVTVAAPSVTVEAQKQAPGVQQIEIIGMPDRESSTVTKVDRSMDGSIKTTETITREADSTASVTRKRTLLDRLLGR